MYHPFVWSFFTTCNRIKRKFLLLNDILHCTIYKWQQKKKKIITARNNQEKYLEVLCYKLNINLIKTKKTRIATTIPHKSHTHKPRIKKRQTNGERHSYEHVYFTEIEQEKQKQKK